MQKFSFSFNSKAQGICALLACFLFLFCSSVQAVSFSNLKDRLIQPAVYFENSERSLFIDVQRVGSRLVAVGERGHIIYSDDQGATWLQANVPISTLLTAVYFPDDELGWAVGHGGVVLHSNDAGKNWVKQFDGERANALTLAYLQNQMVKLNKDLEQAEEYDKEDISYAMEDLAFAIEDAEIDSQIGASKPLLDVWFKNRNEGYVIGAYGFFFHTLDGGKTWSYAADRLENFDRYHLNAMTELSGGALMIVGEAGQMFASYDAGETWETLYGPYQGSLFGIQATDQNEEVIVYGLRGNAYKSSDAGNSWDRLDIPSEATLTSSDFLNGELVLVGFSGVVLKSRDRGESFNLHQTNRFDAYNGVILSGNQGLLLAGDMGVKTVKD